MATDVIARALAVSGGRGGSDGYTKAEVDALLTKKEDDILHFKTWEDYEKVKNTIPVDTYFVIEEETGEDISSVVVNDINELLKTTKDYVIVMHNNSPYGDNGICAFSVREGENVGGYTRLDGTVVYPIANQTPPPMQYVPRKK